MLFFKYIFRIHLAHLSNQWAYSIIIFLEADAEAEDKEDVYDMQIEWTEA